jgi:hypothetical protein
MVFGLFLYTEYKRIKNVGHHICAIPIRLDALQELKMTKEEKG